MTTSQTIDGVPRADLELFLVYGTLTEESRSAGDRLRAMLDAPVLVQPKRLGVHHVLGAIHNVPGFPGVKGNHIHDLTALLNGVLAEAEQPAPVAVAIQGSPHLRGQSFIRNCQVTCCGSCPGGCTIQIESK